MKAFFDFMLFTVNCVLAGLMIQRGEYVFAGGNIAVAMLMWECVKESR